MKPELILCKPDRTPIAILSESYDVKYTSNIGELSLLSFKVPFKLHVRHKYINNKHLDLIQERYLMKFKLRNIEEYFTIQKLIKSHSESEDDLAIDCINQAAQLSRRNITNYNGTNKNASQLLNDVLNTTSWAVGSIDGEFNTSYRSIEFSGSVYDAVVAIAETFEALFIFNTLNKTVNFYKPKTYGSDKGFRMAYGKLLDSITYESNTTEQTTRLMVRGKDNITITSVTSSGTPYLENYSYYFDDMSTSLRNAMLSWTELKDNKESIFSGYLVTLEGLRSNLATAEGQLSDLKSDLNDILYFLDVYNSQGEDVTSTIEDLNNKKSDISSKENEIVNIHLAITSITTQINNLIDELSIENNLTPSQILELDEYIYEGEYTNEYVSDPKKLKELATEHFNDILEPQLSVDISMVNLFEVLDLQESPDLNKVNLGDVVTIEYELSKIDVKARITGINIDFENENIDLTISNVSKNRTAEDKWVKNLYTSVGNSSAFAANKYAYDNTIERTDEVSQILRNTWSAIDREIEGGLNNSVSITRRGIITSDIDDPQRLTIIQNSHIGLSKNGGLNWTTALSPDGIIANHLLGHIVITNNLLLSNQSGSFVVNELGAVIKDLDLIVTQSNLRSRTIISPFNGFKVQKNNGTIGSPVWADQITLDDNGDAIFKGQVSIGSGNSVFKADTNGIYLGHSNFTNAPFSVNLLGIVKASNVNITGGTMAIGSRFNVAADGTVTMTNANISGNINMTGGSISWGSVTKPSYSPGEVGALSLGSPMLTHISPTGIYTGVLHADQINAGTINADRIATNISQVDQGLYIGTYLDTGEKAIIFGDSASISRPEMTDALDIAASGFVTISSSYIVKIEASQFTFNGQQVATRQWVQTEAIARFG